MSITLQLIIVILLIILAIIYFINRGRKNKNDDYCDENCSQCDLYKYCKSKK